MATNSNLGLDLLLNADGDLAGDPTGDFARTPDGLTCLVQDIENGLRLATGDLFGHAESGAGVPRLVGQKDVDTRLIRVIEDFLVLDEMVAPRIDPSSVAVTRLTSQENSGEGRVEIVFASIEDGKSNTHNLIYNAKTGEIENWS